MSSRPNSQQFISDDLETKIGAHVTEQDVRELLLHARKLNVSDICFESNMPIMVKKNNGVAHISHTIIQADILKRITGVLFGSREGDDSAYTMIMNGKLNDTTYEFPVRNKKPGSPKEKIRYRVNATRRGNDSVSIRARLNTNEILRLEDIGQTSEGEIYKNMFPMKGLNFVTGSVDSGKTTLIYACLAEFILNDERPAFIDTFESPMEGDLMGLAKKSIHKNKSVNQCPVPDGLPSFSKGVEGALRRNTDIILFGELREREEFDAVMQGVLSTGKLLMGTLHTDNLPGSIQRLVRALDTGDAGKTRALVFDLISALNFIVSQKLLTRLDGGRVAVYECLKFTKEIKAELKSLPVEEISEAITVIMKQSGATMVDKAKVLLDDGVISEEVFANFKDSFSY